MVSLRPDTADEIYDVVVGGEAGGLDIKKDKLFRIAKALQRIGDGAWECFFYSDHVIVLILILMIRLGFIEMLVTARKTAYGKSCMEQAAEFLLPCFLIIPAKTWKVNEGEAWRRFPGRYFKKQQNRKYVRFPRRFHLHLNGGYGMITTCIMT